MFFKPDPEEATRRIMDGRAWDDFCDMLKAAGQVIQRPSNPDDLQTRVEGLRYLTRLSRAALETFVEFHDPAAPSLRRVVHETVKMGADNPDNHYLNASISGHHRYVIRGKRHTVHWLEFATQKGAYGQGGGMPPTGHLDATDMAIEADGSFVLHISTEPPAEGGNWLPMEADSGTLIVRQSRLDPAVEVLAELDLERVDGDGLPTPMDAVRLEEGLRRASMLVGGAANIFSDWAEGFQQHTNELPRFDQALSDRMGGVPHIVYHHSYWRLGRDEALVIEATPPQCDHWNFQLNNHWMESLDYRFFRIHVNSATAHVEEDGSIRVIVAHTDPGHPNWVQTDGHGFGTMCFRWVRPGVDDPPEPSTRVVKLAELA